jgi:hypothetical protein
LRTSNVRKQSAVVRGVVCIICIVVNFLSFSVLDDEPAASSYFIVSKRFFAAVAISRFFSRKSYDPYSHDDVEDALA